MNLQLTLAARYLGGRKLRTFLTTSAVVFGVLVVFGMNIILPTMLAALQANAMAASGVVDLTITHETGDAFPQEVLSKVQGVAGVRAATASLKRTVNLPADYYDRDPARLDKISALSLIGIDPYGARSVRTYPLTSGRYLEDGDGASALITQSLADALSLRVGDRFPIPSVEGVTELTVAGILLPRTEPGNEEVLVTLPEAQQLTGEAGRVNTIDVALNDIDETVRAETIKEIETALGEHYRTGSMLSGEEMFAALKLGWVAFSMFGLLALFMGAFIIFNTFRTIVVERRHDIGMLRAVGASRGTIVGIILAEGLLQGVIGTAAGLLLGYLMGAGILRIAEPIVGLFLNLKMGPPVVSPLILAVSILLGIGVTVLAGLIPAINASRVTPLEALRPLVMDIEHRRRMGRGFVAGLIFIGLALLALFSGQVVLVGPGALLILVGLVLIAPALVQPIAALFGKLIALIYARQGTGELAQGNLTRQPARVAVTASATMLGLAIVVAVSGMVTSLAVTLADVMKKSLGSDYLFIPPSVALWGSNLGAGEGFADRLRSLDGVGDVSTMRYAESLVNGRSVSLMGIDPVVFPKVGGLYFQQGNDSAYREMLAGHAMIVNGAFLAATGTNVGDTVDLVTPNGRVRYRIAALASDLFNVKITTAYISQADMQAGFGSTEDVFIQLNLKSGADAEAVDRQIKAIAADFPQFRIISGRVYYTQMLAQMNAAFSIMYFILAVLALPSLIAMLNTLAIGVIERTREIGMLRAVGATRKQIRTMVITEALLLAAIGAAFGILCGLYLGYVIVSALAPIFPLGYYFPLSGILAAIAIGLIFGVLAAIIPARQAARMNVVEALRYE
jgi:putative ABC transport system permease protein